MNYAQFPVKAGVMENPGQILDNSELPGNIHDETGHRKTYAVSQAGRLCGNSASFKVHFCQMTMLVERSIS